MNPTKHITVLDCFQMILLLALFAWCGNALSQSTTTLKDSVNPIADSSGNGQSDTSTAGGENSQPPPKSLFRMVPGFIADSLKKTDGFEYANDPDYLKSAEIPDSRNYFWEIITSRVAGLVLYALMIAVLVYAFYKIVVDNKFYLFYAKPAGSAVNSQGEDAASQADIESKIKEAMLTKDYKSAVRFMYIKVLRVLDEKGLIHYYNQFTNLDYATQLQSTGFERDFKYFTHVYEHVWFGGFQLNEQVMSSLTERFNHFYETVNH